MKITDIYLEKELAPVTTQAHDVRVVDVPPAVLREYVGLYRLDPGAYVRIRLEDTKLSAEATREKPLVMSPMSEREFSLGNGEGRVIGFIVNSDPRNRNLRFVKRK